MEHVIFAFGVLGPLERLVRDLKNHVKNHKQAPDKLEDIAIRFQLSHESLSSLKGMVEQGWPQGFPQASKVICEKKHCASLSLRAPARNELKSERDVP